MYSRDRFQIGVLQTHWLCFIVVFSFIPSAICADDQSSPSHESAAAHYRKLIERSEQGDQPRDLAAQFIKLADETPEDPIAIDSLLWVVNHLRRGDDLAKALQRLADRYAKSDKLETICAQLAERPSLASENLLRKLLDDNPHRQVQAQACFQLAAYLDKQRSLIELLKGQGTEARRVEQFYGREYTRHLMALDESLVGQEIERLYERVLKSFADVALGDSTLGDLAEKQLFAIRYLSVGRPAAEIDGEDINGRRMKLSDFRGKVVLLDFWGHW